MKLRLVLIGVLLLHITYVFPVKAEDYCFAEAEAYYKVDRRILYAVSEVESGVNNKAVRTMKNGKKTKRYDVGHMQINSWWGFTANELADPCFQTLSGAAILSDCLASYGNGVDALSCYNSGKPLSKLTIKRKEEVKRYIQKVYNAILAREG